MVLGIMRVKVTPQDIRDGCRSEGTACPLACAVARAAGTSWVWVDPERVMVYSSRAEMESEDWEQEYLKRWELPWAVSAIIRRYDATGLMEPFAFEL